MKKKQIKIKILPDGRIEAETVGITGKSCTSYITVLEKLLNAKTISSSYTDDYYVSETVESKATDKEYINEHN